MFSIIQKYALIALAILLPGLMLLAWGLHQRAERAESRLAVQVAAYGRLTGALEAQKEEAAGKLKAATAGALAQTQRLEEFRTSQEKTDATHRQDVERLRRDLLAFHAARLRDDAERARRGAGGGGAPGADPAGAGDRPRGGADAAGVLPAEAAGAGDEADDAFIADKVNLAYASCRADALKVREVLAPAP